MSERNCIWNHGTGEFHAVPNGILKCPLCLQGAWQCAECDYMFCDSPTCEWTANE